MLPLPDVIILVLVPFAPLFSHRVWLHAQLLRLGTILVPVFPHLIFGQPPPVWNCVMFGAGGFGYFLTDSKYSSTTLSAGPEALGEQPGRSGFV